MTAAPATAAYTVPPVLDAVALLNLWIAARAAQDWRVAAHALRQLEKLAASPAKAVEPKEGE